MNRDTLRHKVQQLFTLADVQIGGNRPWDIQVHENKFYANLLAGGSLALGQSYMDGWWDCTRLDEFFYQILRARLESRVKPRGLYYDALKAKLYNFQKPSRAYQVGHHHYDIGNDLYRLMLGERMIYSCGYWETASTLDEAQEAKLNLVCRKLDLQSGMRVLDIGCGWGGTARYAAEQYGVEVVGITVSEQQARLGKALCKGLPVDIRLQDYRTIEEKYDRVLSIGMFEHVGYKNYRSFMRIVRNCLNENGLFLLHTIGGNRSVTRNDPWIDRYIFPNAMLPSARQICSATEGVFVLEDWHSFGADYDKTLMQWYDRFIKNWDILKESYDEQFYRMWTYYLLVCAGTFRARSNQLWQLLLSPDGIPGGYSASRYQ